MNSRTGNGSLRSNIKRLRLGSEMIWAENILQHDSELHSPSFFGRDEARESRGSGTDANGDDDTEVILDEAEVVEHLSSRPSWAHHLTSLAASLVAWGSLRPVAHPRMTPIRMTCNAAGHRQFRYPMRTPAYHPK